MLNPRPGSVRVVASAIISHEQTQIKPSLLFSKFGYRNDPKFSDRYAWVNSADPDQTAPRGFAIPSASFGLITL